MTTHKLCRVIETEFMQYDYYVEMVERFKDSDDPTIQQIYQTGIIDLRNAILMFAESIENHEWVGYEKLRDRVTKLKVEIENE